MLSWCQGVVVDVGGFVHVRWVVNPRHACFGQPAFTRPMPWPCTMFVACIWMVVHGLARGIQGRKVLGMVGPTPMGLGWRGLQSGTLGFWGGKGVGQHNKGHARHLVFVLALCHTPKGMNRSLLPPQQPFEPWEYRLQTSVFNVF
jgi:hypothetical protein